MVKLGFTWVCIIFLISTEKIDCGYRLEPSRRVGSNGYPQSMFSAEIRKNIRNFQGFFFVVKISIYLKRRVFVMECLALVDIYRVNHFIGFILFGYLSGIVGSRYVPICLAGRFHYGTTPIQIY